MKTSKYTNQAWNIGDVYAYKLDNALANEEGLSGRYFLLQKVGEIEISPRMITPVVYIKITKGDTLPRNIREYDQLEYVQTKATSYAQLLLAYMTPSPEEHAAQAPNCVYEKEACQLFPQYRALLLLAEGTRIPPHLTYVGRYTNAAPPKEECIPNQEQNYRMVYWKNNATLFGRIMIRAYCQYNLKAHPACRYRARTYAADSSSRDIFLS